MKKILITLGVLLILAIILCGFIVIPNLLNGTTNITGDSANTAIIELETGKERYIGQSLILTQDVETDAELSHYVISCEKTDGDHSNQKREWKEKQIVLNLDAESRYRITVTPKTTSAAKTVHTWKALVSKNIRKCTAYRLAAVSITTE